LETHLYPAVLHGRRCCSGGCAPVAALLAMKKSPTTPACEGTRGSVYCTSRCELHFPEQLFPQLRLYACCETWRRATSRHAGPRDTFVHTLQTGLACVPSCFLTKCWGWFLGLFARTSSCSALRRHSQRPRSVDDRPRGVLSSRLAPPTRPCVCRQQIVSMAVAVTCWIRNAAARAVCY